MTFPDHFSAVADRYRAFRPTYPEALFDHVAAACPGRGLAWECGAGSGQATPGLTARFRRVVATDASVAQLGGLVGLGVAGAWPVACLAEAPPLPDGCADLVAAAQSIHWFRLDAFLAEVRRVARRGAVLAAWTYGFPSVAPDVDPVLLGFGEGTVGPYWPPERVHVDAGYRTLDFSPFEELPAPAFESSAELTGEDVLGLMTTWSAVKRAREATGADPVEALRPAWRAAWGPLEHRRRVTWPVTLRMFRVAEG